jgi:hypothetical protein
MKKISFTIPAFLFSLTILFSCTDSEVHFENPQPGWVTKNETMFPKNLQGYYANGKDTMLITEKRIVDTKIKPDFDLNLSDSILLKTYDHNYFLNMRGDGEKNWGIIMAKVENNYMILYMLSCKDSTIQKRLKEITTVKETKDSSGQVTDFIINPTDEEFRQILEQNLFTVSSDTMKKVK